MNLPNKLTVVRIVLTPFFLAAMLLKLNYNINYLIAAVIFIAASVTDFLDGRIARKNGIVTTFGKLCDPLADKMLTTAALLAFMQLGVCNIWIVMTVLTREFLITSFRLVAAAQGVVIAAGKAGKLKTLISNILLSITAALAVISGVKYIIDGKKVIDFSK